MSGSDLAPFVAATLRDKVFYELQQENAILQGKLAAKEAELTASRICITSPGGSIVYAQGSLVSREIHSTGLGEVYQKVEFENNTDMQVCPVNDIEKCEIRVGDVCVCTIGDFVHTDDLSQEGDDFCEPLYNIMLPTQAANPTIETLGQKVLLLVKYGPRPESMAEEEWEGGSADPNQLRNEDIEQVQFVDAEFINADALDAVTRHNLARRQARAAQQQANQAE